LKGLGASYAVYNYIKYLNKNIEDKEPLTFCSATAGNHGKSLSCSFKNLKWNCVIYVPKYKDIARIKIENIKKEGEIVIETGLDFDDTVKIANEESKMNNWVFIKDVAIENYTEIPKAIVTGYMTSFYEFEEMKLNDKKKIMKFVLFFLLGVRSWASSGVIYLIKKYFKSLKENKENLNKKIPKIILVKPEGADCLLDQWNKEN